MATEKGVISANINGSSANMIGGMSSVESNGTFYLSTIFTCRPVLYIFAKGYCIKQQILMQSINLSVLYIYIWYQLLSLRCMHDVGSSVVITFQAKLRHARCGRLYMRTCTSWLIM